MSSLKDKAMPYYEKHYALVTGASSGIGKAIASELAKRKMNLLLVDLPQTGLEDVAELLQSIHAIDVQTFCVDLTSEDSAIKIFEFSQKKMIRITVLVNNAGLGNTAPLNKSSPGMLRVMMKLNNDAMIMLTQKFLIQASGSVPSYILNVGSLASFFPIPRKSVYSATKSFVYAFSCALRSELRGSMISVSCLCPGSTATSPNVRKNLEQTAYKGKLFTQTAEEVATVAVEEMFRGVRRIIPGWQNKMVFALWSVLPYFLCAFLLEKIFHPKTKEGMCSKQVLKARPSPVLVVP